MGVSIKQVILHVLDTNIMTPVLADKPLALTEEVLNFVELHTAKSFASDDVRIAEFFSESQCQKLISASEDFIELSKNLAQLMFKVMSANVNIPSADLLVLEALLDDIPYLVVLKLNYKTSYIHRYDASEGANITSLIKQRTVLPSTASKIEEAFFVNLNDFSLKVLEKKYEKEGKRDFYLSQEVLECSQPASEKTKFKNIKKAAEEAVKSVYPVDTVVTSEIANMICEEIADDHLDVKAVERKLSAAYPLAQSAFTKELEACQISTFDAVKVSPTTVKKLEKQSLHTESGIEVKIPVQVLSGDNAVEFINNADGSISLLIKNIIL